jgi:DNA-binding protein HU-beta
MNMNKSDLIEQMAKQADITKAQATRALDAYLDSVKNYLRRGGHVSILGFGTFKSVKRNARMGRNPRTGAAIKIKARRVPVFKPGKNLKDALN